MPRSAILLLLLLALGASAQAALAPVRIVNGVPVEGELGYSFGKAAGADEGAGQGIETRGHSGRFLTSDGKSELVLTHSDPLVAPVSFPISLDAAQETVIIVFSKAVRDAEGRIRSHTLLVESLTAPRELKRKGGGKLFALSVAQRPNPKILLNGTPVSLVRGKRLALTPKPAAYITASLPRQGAVDPADGDPDPDGDAQQCPFPKRAHVFLVVFDVRGKGVGFQLMR